MDDEMQGTYITLMKFSAYVAKAQLILPVLPVATDGLVSIFCKFLHLHTCVFMYIGDI
jgi:hypothetical protein